MVVVFLNWSIVFFDFLKNLQYCVSFRYTAQWFRYIFFSDSFPFWLFQYIEYSSLCCTVNPCCLSESRSGSQSCPTLSDLIDYSLPGFSVHEIPQARILEWVAIPFSRVSSWPRDQTQVSCIVGRFFTIGATREAPRFFINSLNPLINSTKGRSVNHNHTLFQHSNHRVNLATGIWSKAECVEARREK